MSAEPASTALSSRGTPRAAVIQPRSAEPTIAEAERAFRQARRTVFGHVIFVGVCCVLALIFRKLLHLPTVMIGAILIAAFVVFANDIIRMFLRRHQLKRALHREAGN